jgi:ABC-type transporter Mla subunit MlaD
MQTIIIILVVISILAAVYYFGFYKQGKINDRDGDFIPDEIEDAVEDVKEVAKTVKRRAKKVKAELGDVVDELQDVVQAFKGKPTKSKLNSLTKQQLIDAAKKDHGADFDLTVKKSTLVNKVYSLYNKK